MRRFQNAPSKSKRVLDLMLPPLKRKSRHWRPAVIRRACRRATTWKGAGSGNSQRTEIDPWTVAREAGLARDPRPIPEIDYDFDPPEIKGDTPVALAASAVFALKMCSLEKPFCINRSSSPRCKGRGSRRSIRGSRIEESGELVRLDDHEVARHWTTTAIAAEEAKLLRLIKERVPGLLFRPDAVELALQAVPFLSDQQRTAIRHATSPDPTAVLEAGAGPVRPP